jgi:hypothetical protein
LKASKRNCSEWASRMRNVRTSPVSSSTIPGPARLAIPRFP